MIRKILPAALMLGTLLAVAPAEADILWLNDMGHQAFPGTSKNGITGVVMPDPNDPTGFLWRPYMRNWAPAEPIQVKWAYVKKIKHEIDSHEDVTQIRKRLIENLTDVNKKTAGARSMLTNPVYVVRAVLEAEFRLKRLGAEAEPGVTARASKLLRSLLEDVVANPNSYPEGSDQRARAHRMLLIGGEARKAMLDLVRGVRRSLDNKNERSDPNGVHPFYLAYHAMRYMPLMTYQIKSVANGNPDRDLRSLCVDATDIYLTLINERQTWASSQRLGSSNSSVQGQITEFWKAVHGQLILTAKASENARTFLRSEFTKPTPIIRKRWAALALIVAAREKDPKLVELASQQLCMMLEGQKALADLVEQKDDDESIRRKVGRYVSGVSGRLGARPDSRDEVCDHLTKLLVDLLQMHPAARQVVAQRVEGIEGRRRGGRLNRADRALVQFYGVVREVAGVASN